MAIIDGDSDHASNVSNLTNIMDSSKGDLYNKLKEVKISMLAQPSCSKEGTIVDLTATQHTRTGGSAAQGNSESQ